MVRLKKGDPAPGFSLKDQAGEAVDLADLRGKKVLLYFYPRADTPGCTKQACSVRDSDADLTGQGIVTLGVSPDKPEKQKKFDEKYSLGFPLLSDPDHETAAAYGAWGEKVRFGKKSEGIIRSSFLIDESGSVVEAWYNVKPDATVPKALAAASG